MVIIWIILLLFAFYGLTKLMDPKPSSNHKINEEEEKLQKGYSFEQQITQIVSEKLKGAIVINNCILNKKSKSGKDIYFDGTVASKEIDVIILSKKGFFVVEAKNFSQAFVSGNLNDKTWLTSYSKKKVYNVYSPLKQVTEAVTTLKRYLPDYNFKRLVVFPDSTKVSKNLKTTNQVLSLTEFRWFLDDVSESYDSEEQNSINLIKNLLIEENERARALHNDADHLEYVKKVREAAS